MSYPFTTGAPGGKENAADQKILDDLHAEKLELISELRLIEKSLKSAKSNELPVGALPPNTTLTYSIQADLELRALLLKVEANKDVQIINFMAVDLGMFANFYVGLFLLKIK